ncbi:hypothetical protein L798_07141 [Zootermopsis nevadensis]|uniref:Uncharacterized protein n=1 Tax=Zootermopsis nevadensis TaxID=136037 RepID=A0A067RTR4_ZOONE|nr:hypothetical protein L798_07141 [Zootermopsis nevadensis]
MLDVRCKKCVSHFCASTMYLSDVKYFSRQRVSKIAITSYLATYEGDSVNPLLTSIVSKMRLVTLSKHAYHVSETLGTCYHLNSEKMTDEVSFEEDYNICSEYAFVSLEVLIKKWQHVTSQAPRWRYVF